MKKFKVIAVTNNKGGVGKTFLATHIAWGLKKFYNRKVVVLDGDTDQADAVKWITGLKVSNPEMNKIYKGIEDLPVMWTAGKDISIKEEFDGIVVIDGRPNVAVSGGAIYLADIVIFPVDGRLSIENLKVLLNMIKVVEGVKRKIVIVNRQKLRTNLSKTQFDLARSIDAELYPIPLTESVRVGEAENEGKPLWLIKKSKTVDTLKSFIEYINRIINEIK